MTSIASISRGMWPLEESPASPILFLPDSQDEIKSSHRGIRTPPLGLDNQTHVSLHQPSVTNSIRDKCINPHEPTYTSKPKTEQTDSGFKYDPDAAAKGWRVARDALARKDEKMVKAYQEEIDSLLYFAGLFSAILTAFVAQTYQNLQPDHAYNTNLILVQISQQLSGPVRSPVAVIPDFTAASSDVRINVLWFVALILSLGSSLFGIFVKQWLRSYMTWVDISPAQSAARVRQYRYNAMLKWKFPQVITVLPVLLQAALILFGIGLVDFAINLNQTVGKVLLAAASICLLAVLCCSLMPLVSHSSPYRSPWSGALDFLRCLLFIVFDPRLWIFFWAFMLAVLVAIAGTVAGWLCLFKLERYMNAFCELIFDVVDADSKIQFIEHKLFDTDTGLLVEWGFFTWNGIDRKYLRALSSQRRMNQDKAPKPSWEACSLNALLSSARNEEELFNSTIFCVYSQRDHALANPGQNPPLHIADCCQVAGTFFGISSEPTIIPLHYRRWDNSIATLSPSTKDNVYLFLREALTQYIKTDDSSPGLVNYAGEVLKMLGFLVDHRNERYGDLAVLDYLNLIIVMIDKCNKKDTTANALSPYIVDSLCLACQSLSTDALTRHGIQTWLDPARVDVTDMIARNGQHSASLDSIKAIVERRAEALIRSTQYDWNFLQTRHQTQMCHQLLRTVGGQRALSLILSLAVAADTGIMEPEPRARFQTQHSWVLRTRGLLKILSSPNGIALAYSRYIGSEQATDLKYLLPAFWQSICRLGSETNLNRQSLFRDCDSLVRHLCVLSLRETHKSESLVEHFAACDEDKIMTLPMDHVWGILLDHSQWLGSKDIGDDEWICPGFERWTGPRPARPDFSVRELHLNEGGNHDVNYCQNEQSEGFRPSNNWRSTDIELGT